MSTSTACRMGWCDECDERCDCPCHRNPGPDDGLDAHWEEP